MSAELISAAPAYGLTPTMRDVLLIVQELTALDGVAPSYAEIARECSLSSAGRVCRIVDDLIDRGHLARLPCRHRSLVVLHPVPMPEEPEIELTSAGVAAVRR